MATAGDLNISGWQYQVDSPHYDGNTPTTLRPVSEAVWSATTDYDHASAGQLMFSVSRVDLTGPGNAEILVTRAFGASGAVSATVRTNSTTGAFAMTSGVNFTQVDQVVSFADQEVGVKKVTVPVTSVPSSGLHIIIVTMDTPTGGVVIRHPQMDIYVDDGLANPSATTVVATDNVQAALDATSAGDLVYFSPSAGDFSDSTRYTGDWGGFKPRNAGTQFSPIVLQSSPGTTAIINQAYAQSTGGFNVACGFVPSANYIRIKGFELKNMLHTAIAYGGANLQGIVVEDCHIHDLGNPPNGIADYLNESDADNIGGTLLDGTYGAIQRYNEIHDIYDVRTNTGTSNPWNAYAASAHSGIHGFYLERAWIHHNTIYRVAKGIFQKNPDDTDGIGHRIHDNKFSQVIETAVSLQFAGAGQPGANYVYVHDNQVDCTATGSETCNTINAVMPAAEQTSDAHHLWAHNNTQIEGGKFYTGGAIKNLTLYSNIAYNTDGPITLDEAAASSNIEYCDHNCWFGTFQVVTQRFTGNQQTYNDIASFRLAVTPTDAAILNLCDASSITTEPTFANAGAGDYRTLSGVTLGVGRYGRDIGIGDRVVGA